MLENVKIFSLEGLSAELANGLLQILKVKFPGFSFQLAQGASARPELRAAALGLVTKSDQDLLQIEVTEFISRAGAGGERFTSEVLWNTAPSARTYSKIKPMGIDDSRMTDMNGVFVFAGSVATLMCQLDELIVSYAKTKGSQAIHLPSLISEENLRQAGCLPRDVHQVSRVVPIFDQVNSSAKFCLTPAGCLPLYPSLSGRRNLAGSSWTCCCRVHRFEAGQLSTKLPADRLWEFRVREIIFFDHETGLRRQREDFVRFTNWLCKELQLSARLCTATDSFFHAEAAEAMIFQLMQQSKLELRLGDSGHETSVASFNSHGNHFTQAFVIGDEGEDLHSACAAFGLERWAQGLVAQLHEDVDSVAAKIQQLKQSIPRQPWV